MNKQNKFATVIMTALLVLLMAGSAMCATYDSNVTLENKDGSWQPILGDDTNANEPPEIVRTENDAEGYQAGDEPGVTVSAIVCDYDGVDDLMSMMVTANFSHHGIDGLVAMEFIEMIDCTCAYYESEPVVITQSTCDYCGGYNQLNGNGHYCEQVDVDIVATDLSGEYDEDATDFYVYPGECAYLKIRDHPNGDEPETKALTQLSWCYVYGYNYLPYDWYWNNDYNLYYNYYSVYSYDEYGNCIGMVGGGECCDYFTATVDSPASLHYYNGCYHYGYNYITVYNDEYAADVVLRVHCVGNEDVEGDELTIRFLQPVSNVMDVTSDAEFVYANDGCGVDDCYNITVQLMDVYGEPIPMPGVDVRLYINSEPYMPYDIHETDDNGTATFVDVCIGLDDVGTISIRAEAECREGSLQLDAVGKVMDHVEINTTPNPLTYTCYTDHDTEMCCDGGIWSCNEFGEINETTGYFTAGEYAGIAVVEVNVSGVIGTAEIVVNGEKTCNTTIIAGAPFTVTSSGVSISGNFTDDGGFACLKVLGDPIPEFDNDTIGAIVDASENVTLDFNGTGDMWVCNETTENWTKYATGDTAEVPSGRGMYALIYDEPVPDPDPEPTPTATTKRSNRGSGGGGGTYPPDPVPTPTPNATDNETDQDDPKPAAAKMADVKPTVNLPGDTTLDTTSDETEGDAPGGADPTNTIFIVLGIMALIVIGYVIYRKSQN